jgi:uncharacterized protein (TIGR03067 family)
MIRRLLGVVAVSCLAALAAPAAEEKKADKDAIQGAWDLTSVEISGTKVEVPPGKGISLTFSGDKVTKKEAGKKEEEGTFRLNDTTKPKEIDLTVPKKGDPTAKMTLKGVYELDGDTLRIGMPKGDEDPRPAAMDKANGVLIFKKKK